MEKKLVPQPQDKVDSPYAVLGELFQFKALSTECIMMAPLPEWQQGPSSHSTVLKALHSDALT